MTPSPAQLRETLLEFIAEDVVCDVLEGDPSRVGCVTPLQYPDGDSVVVWVREQAGLFEVSDWGESLSGSAGLTKSQLRTIHDSAKTISRAFSVDVSDRVGGECTADELGEYVWLVASAAAQIAQTVGGTKPKMSGPEPEDEFTDEVTEVFAGHAIPVKRDHRLRGDSGHTHRATIFVPRSEAVLEPVGGHWNQVASAFTKFSDLHEVNGFGLYTLLDDRQPKELGDATKMLVQVSDVLRWTEQDSWIAKFEN